MKKVAIIAAENSVLSTIASPMDMFLQAGTVWDITMGQTPELLFDVKVVTADGQPVMALNNMPVTPACSMHALDDVDLIVIPSQGFFFDPNEKHHDQRIKWLQERYEDGSDLASVCAGAFTLASTGLLDGKTATTHWGLAKQFKQSFPEVDLRTDLLVTDEGQLFCSGGVSADLNLSLYLIEKYYGREVAYQTSRCTMVDLDCTSQSPFIAFNPEKNHSDSKILEAQKYLEKNLREKVDIDQLAETLDLSVRQLNRRFKSATGETVNNYLQLTRIEAAKVELVNSPLAFEEIAVKVGYENVSFFRRIFKKSTSLTPAQYRKRFSQF